MKEQGERKKRGRCTQSQREMNIEKDTTRERKTKSRQNGNEREKQRDSERVNQTEICWRSRGERE